MLSSIEILNTFNKSENGKEYKIKEKVEDFIVQEVVEGVKCTIRPLLDIEKYYKAVDILENLPIEELSKLERKNIYSTVNHHPFKRLFTKNGKLATEQNSKDNFVFTLLKYDYSTNYLINLLSKRLNVPQTCIQMGGTKDKRGITLQEISVNVSFEVLFTYAASLLKNDNWKIPLVGYEATLEAANQKSIKEMKNHMKIYLIDVPEAIMICDIRRGNSKRLGDLDGNFFTIKIRDLFDFTTRSTSFYNYFGTQRFGMNLNNHLVGEHILKEEYNEALDMIISDDTNYNPVQSMIIKLREQKNKAKYIVSKIPRHAKMIYLHAFQSYLFNKSINSRIEANTPLIGEDKIFKDGEFINVVGTESLEYIYIPLRRMDDKLLKGGNRRMIESIQNLDFHQDSDGTTISFFLNKSCYATIVLRELIGNVSMNSIE